MQFYALVRNILEPDTNSICIVGGSISSRVQVTGNGHLSRKRPSPELVLPPTWRLFPVNKKPIETPPSYIGTLVQGAELVCLVEKIRSQLSLTCFLMSDPRIELHICSGVSNFDRVPTAENFDKALQEINKWKMV
jgi:hypothetical protein